MRGFFSVLGIILLVLLFAGGSLLTLRVNYLFLNTTGHSNVFWTPLTTQFVLFLIGFAVMALLVAVNIPVWRAAGRHLDPQAARWFTQGGIALAVVAGIATGVSLAGQWQDVLLWQHGTLFHQSDPVFGKDYSFFLFTLPVLDDIQGVLWGAAVIALLAGIGLAVLSKVVEHVPPAEMSLPLRPALGSDPRDAFAIGVRLAGAALAVVFVLAALGAHFGQYHLATMQHDGFVGLDATERNVLRPMLTAMQYIAAALALAVALVLGLRRNRPATGTAGVLGAMFGGWLLLAGILQTVPEAVYQSTVAGPNALSKQSPSLNDYLATSRVAWGLQDEKDVDTRAFGSVVAPKVEDLTADPETLRNVRIQDYRLLPETFKQIDRSRSYQTYPTITVDRYPNAAGAATEVMLGPREIAEGDIPNKGFVNSALLYTHGYGITAVSVNQVQPDGSPQVIVGGLPGSPTPSDSLPVLNTAVSQDADPRIYCGLSTTQPVIVNTTQKEFDYPSARGDATSHAGTNMVGIPANNFVDKFAMSASVFGGIDMLLTSSVTSESKVLMHRAISDRVTTIAPFLTVDKDPYIVADPVSRHLVWIADAYVTSDRFPNAFRQADGSMIGMSYARNSVKVVVDARTCKTTLYMVDSTEPITAAYSEIFPGLLQPFDSMPAALRAHLRYPEDLLTAQSQAYAQVHVKDASVLFTKSDAWRVSDENVNNVTVPTQAYYVELTLPGSTKPEFVLLQTFSPASNSGTGGSANNMTAWLAAQSDYTTTSHPKLVAVPLNNGSNVLGPLQFDNNINTNPVISSKLSLLGQGGSRVVLGNVIVLPFNNRSFLYVRPLYVQAASSNGQGSFPQLVDVIVGTKDQVAMDTTFSKALQSLFNTTDPIPGLAISPNGPVPTPGPGGTPAPTPQPGATQSPLTSEAQQLLTDLLHHQELAQQALSKGDLVTYAKEQDAVSKDADRLRALLQAGGTPSPQTSATP